MCNKNEKRKKRSRTKTRKPKYLSLSKHIKSSSSSSSTSTIMTKITPQLNLFPLHPENLVDDRSFADDHNVALLFDSESAAGDASLTGLLLPSSSEHDHDGSPSPSPSYDRIYDSESLVRAAMKRRVSGSDGGGEEKWVCYSEVVEEVTSSSSKDVVWRDNNNNKKIKNKKKKGKKIVRVETTTTTTTTSSCNSEGNSVISANSAARLSSLALKLDYQEILKAWSDKGSLYIQQPPQQQHDDLSPSPQPQTVPDLLQHDHGFMDGWGSSAANLWMVPENNGIKIKEEIDGWKLGQREASVLRYKEKRQSRLFSKRIRYEVRKLNAEKRPRMKGRFVKTS